MPAGRQSRSETHAEQRTQDATWATTPPKALGWRQRRTDSNAQRLRRGTRQTRLSMAMARGPATRPHKTTSESMAAAGRQRAPPRRESPTASEARGRHQRGPPHQPPAPRLPRAAPTLHHLAVVARLPRQRRAAKAEAFCRWGRRRAQLEAQAGPQRAAERMPHQPWPSLAGTA